MSKLPTDPRFLSPAFSIASDIAYIHKIVEAGEYFLCQPIKVTTLGPVNHWKNRAKKILDEDFEDE